MLLAAGLDAIVGALVGGVAGLLLWIGRWGRQEAASVHGWVAAGCLVAAAAFAGVVATAGRHNRFLAAGVVASMALGAGVIGAIVGPALGRLVQRRGPPEPGGVTAAGLLLAAPAVAVVLELILFLVVWRTRLGRVPMALVVALPAALLPWALARASRVGVGVRLGVALGLCGVFFLAPALLVARARWATDLQFVRWNDVLVLVAIPAVGLHVSRRLGSRRRPVVSALAVAGAGLLLFIALGAHEPARKAGSARAGLVGPTLALVTTAFDRDHDGHASLFGGGDCDDHDRDVNPGAQDWPDDGIDQNCDGKDTSVAVLKSPSLHPVPEAVPRDLNLLFVTVDTLRADHLGSYGYGRPTSPEMDRLGAEGAVFENGWAHAPSTRYSMPALATGRWPSAIAWEDCSGCDSWWPRIGTRQRTIGEALKTAGYTTAAFYAFDYFMRSQGRGFERGIDLYDDRRAALHVNVNGPMESVGSSAREMADDVIAFVDQHRQGKWFLWAHFYDPHLNYEPHPDAPKFGSSPTDMYDGEIWFTDQHFGRVLAHLKQAGLWDRTAVVLTGDHGEGLGEHGISAHGYHLYAPQTKVPFIIRVPGLAPRRVTAPIGHVDLAPTLLNLARGAPEPSFLGRSALDLVAGAATSTEPVFQEVTYESATAMDGTKRRGLVTDTHHLIWNWTPDNTTECYDLRADKEEKRDLWGRGDDCVGLKTRLRDLVGVLNLPPHVAERLAEGVSAPGAPSPMPTHKLDARFGQAVRFLGYDLTADNVQTGGQTEITYHFELMESLAPGWKPFFHLQGAGVFRNIDHVPLEGAYPVERWRPGQRIRDRQRITFDLAPGEYTVFLGFYKGQERLPVRLPMGSSTAGDADSRLPVATIVVNP